MFGTILRGTGAQMRSEHRTIQVLVGHIPWPPRSNPLDGKGFVHLPQGQVLQVVNKVDLSPENPEMLSGWLPELDVPAFFFGFPSRKNQV